VESALVLLERSCKAEFALRLAQLIRSSSITTVSNLVLLTKREIPTACANARLVWTSTMEHAWLLALLDKPESQDPVFALPDKKLSKGPV